MLMLLLKPLVDDNIDNVGVNVAAVLLFEMKNEFVGGGRLDNVVVGLFMAISILGMDFIIGNEMFGKFNSGGGSS